MTVAQLKELGFTKLGHDEDNDFPENYYYYTIEFGDLIFHSCGNDEAEEEGGWFIIDPGYSIKIWHFSDAKILIDLLRRNQTS